jgi:hypothetical protein
MHSERRRAPRAAAGTRHQNQYNERLHGELLVPAARAKRAHMQAARPGRRSKGAGDEPNAAAAHARGAGRAPVAPGRNRRGCGASRLRQAGAITCAVEGTCLPPVCAGSLGSSSTNAAIAHFVLAFTMPYKARLD